MSGTCSHYCWVGSTSNFGPALCLYENAPITIRHFQACCITTPLSCEYYLQSLKDNFLELIMNSCSNKGINIDKRKVYNAQEKFRQYLMNENQELEDPVLVIAERIGFEIVNEIKKSKEPGVLAFLEIVYETYIRAFVSAIEKRKYNEAYTLYRKMLGELITNFGLGQRAVAIRTEIKDPSFKKSTKVLAKDKIGKKGSIPYRPYL